MRATGDRGGAGTKSALHRARARRHVLALSVRSARRHAANRRRIVTARDVARSGAETRRDDVGRGALTLRRALSCHRARRIRHCAWTEVHRLCREAACDRRWTGAQTGHDHATRTRVDGTAQAGHSAGGTGVVRRNATRNRGRTLIFVVLVCSVLMVIDVLRS